METFLLNTDTKAGLTVPLDPSLWSSVLGKVGNSSAKVTAAFQAATGDVQNVGVTFGGCYAGHGVYVGRRSCAVHHDALYIMSKRDDRVRI